MRQRARVGIRILVLNVVALLILLAARKPDDGLDWIRKYGGKEGPRRDAGFLIGDGSNSFVSASEVTFTFNEIPNELLIELKRKARRPAWMTSSRIGYEMPDRQLVIVIEGTSQVSITQAAHESWLLQKWRAFKKLLGFKA